MKILAAECSATSVSCAVSENGKIIVHDFSNLKITHSQTLLPMISSVLQKAGMTVKEIDAFAVSVGPGSFTGVRIGISAIKGMAAPFNTKCYGVSSLTAIAQNYCDVNCVAAAVMDARCNQVYTALFRIKDKVVTRLTDDRAMMIDELLKDLNTYKNEKVIIVGDGAHLFLDYAKDNITVAPEERRYQTAVGVIAAAKDYTPVSPAELTPQYLRLPQAERELKAKQERN